MAQVKRNGSDINSSIRCQRLLKHRKRDNNLGLKSRTALKLTSSSDDYDDVNMNEARCIISSYSRMYVTYKVTSSMPFALFYLNSGAASLFIDATVSLSAMGVLDEEA